MLLNHQHRFIFIHVPKAAGTTITRALAPLTTFRDLELGGTQYGEAVQGLFADRFDLRKHSTGAVLRARCPAHVWRRFFVFGFVRNPYARAYSVYRFLRRWKEGPHHRAVLAQDFAGFVGSATVASGEIEIARPQAHWLTRDGAALPGLDFVGRVEEFARDFGFVLSVIHRRPTVFDDARHDNASTEAGEWRAHLTPAIARRIEELYASDFELWGYRRLGAGADAA